tara:strand:+ start:465 stop:644 length:180 start_codon:yes stop_codon:yes gene_type:complete
MQSTVRELEADKSLGLLEKLKNSKMPRPRQLSRLPFQKNGPKSESWKGNLVPQAKHSRR